MFCFLAFFQQCEAYYWQKNRKSCPHRYHKEVVGEDEAAAVRYFAVQRV